MRTKLFLLLTILLLGSVCLTLPAARGTEQNLELNLPGTAPEKLVVVYSKGSAPFHFSDINGQPTGILIDFWRLWSEKTGIALEFVPKSWNGTLEMMKNGKADIHAGLFFSSERDTFLDYASALQKSDTHFFFHKSIFEVNELEDLLPFRIGIVKGDKAIGFVRKRLPDADLAIYSGNKELFEALEEGEIRVFIKDTPIALHHLAQKNMLKEFKYFFDRPMYSNMFYAGVRDGDHQLRTIVEQGMAAVSSQERSAIVRKWLGASAEKSADVVTVAVSGSYMPFSGLGLDGKPIGMVVDIWKLWAEKTGKKVEFRMGDYQTTLQMLRKGQADIHSGLFRTEERQSWLDFSQPFYTIASGILYHTGHSQPDGLGSLQGKRVAVIKESLQEDYLRRTFTDVQVATYQSSSAIMQTMADGEIDCFLAEIIPTEFILKEIGKQGKFKWLADEPLSNKMRAGVKKGNRELLQLIDQGFNAIADQELAIIERHWVPDPKFRRFAEASRQIRLTAEEEAWILTHPQVHIGVNPDFPPFDYLNKNGLHNGLASDYVSLLSERLGITMVIRQGLSWPQVLARAKSGEIDLIPCLARTPELEKYLHFLPPYISSPIVILTNKDYPLIAGLDDLRGKTIAVESNCVAQNILKKNHPALNLLLVSNTAEGLRAVSEKRVDAFVDSLAEISYLSKRLGPGNLKIACSTQYSYDLSFAVRKDWPLMASILEKSLLSITDEEKNQLHDTWLSMEFEHKTDWRRVIRWLLFIGGAAGVIITIIVVWNRKLAHEIIERKKVEEALLIDEERLESLLKLSQLKESSEEELNNYALEECVRLTNSKIGYLHLINQDQQSITLYAWSREVRKTCKAEKNNHYPLEEAGVWADCVRQNGPVIHNDYLSLSDKKELPEGHVAMTRHMSIPVHDGEQIVMVAGVGNKETPYTEPDVRQLSLFMQNMWEIAKAKRAEEKLQLTQFAIDRSSDLAFWIRPDGSLSYANEAACLRLGYSEEELLAMTLTDIDQELAQQSWPDYWQKIREMGSQVMETHYKAHDTAVFPVEISVDYMQFGDTESLFLFARDISTRKTDEESILQNMEELERFSKIAVGREKQMIILKEEVNELLRKSGQEKKYTIITRESASRGPVQQGGKQE